MADTNIEFDVKSTTFIVEAVVCILFAMFLYWIFGSVKKRQWYVTLSTLIGWSACFFIVLLVANDVAQSAQCAVPPCPDVDNTYTSCSNIEIVPRKALVINWQVLYWLTLFLTWGVFPLFQSFSMTGEFTIRRKILISIKENLYMYAIMTVILGIIGVIYIVSFNIQFKMIPATVISAANAYGLFLLIAMLGHGLVNVPRNLWRSAHTQLNLKRWGFEIASLDIKLREAQESLDRSMRLLKSVERQAGTSAIYKKYIDIIVSKCPASYEIIRAEGEMDVNMKKLADLHYTIMSNSHAVAMYYSKYEHAIEQGLIIDAIYTCKRLSKEWRINWAGKQPRTFKFHKAVDVLECLWWCYIRQRIIQTTCIITVVLSGVVVWSELLFFVCEYDLSVFSLYVRYIRQFDVILLQIGIFLPVVYIAWCAYSSLFNLRIFNYYHLVPRQMSDSNSLLFSAAYLCRLSTPLAYNFMCVAHYKTTAFVEVMGDFNVSNVFSSARYGGDYFQTFFPLILLPFIVMSMFDVYTRIGNLLCSNKFRYDEDFTHSLIDDGKRILEEERENLTNDKQHYTYATSRQFTAAQNRTLKSKSSEKTKPEPTESTSLLQKWKLKFSPSTKRQEEAEPSPWSEASKLSSNVHPL